ncbi:MAG: BatD family protein, partial [Kiritimatiellae bacterium]|nr:BatD family protein [Kiritimatiellia bacterium]
MFRMKAGLSLLAACLLPAGAARGEAALSVRVSSQEVLVGDPVQVSVLLSGADAEPAGAPAFDRPDAAPLAGPSRSQQFFSINGRSVSRIGWDYTAYPAGTGVVSFGTARLDVGGRTLSAAVPDIRVVPPPEQPWVRLTLECDKSEVLVDEAFDAVLGVEVRLPSAEGWRDKPFHPRACPALSVPWLAARPAENAAMRASLSDLLDPYVARGGAGFTVNGLSSDPFASLGGGFPAMPGFGGSLFDRGPLVFAFPRTFVERDGARFARYELRVPMVATDLGETRLAPVRFEGRVVADPPAGAVRPHPAKKRGAGEILAGIGAIITDPFVALSPPLSVRVVPPPAEGRPASFCGALAASLAAEASLDTQTCRQGDPVELSIKLSGDFVRSTVQAPDPSLAEGFADLFRAWDDPVREDLPDGSVRFRYKLRALAAGTVDVPSVPVSYFDTAARAYATVRTAPLPLRVEAVAAFDAGGAFAAASNAVASYAY